MLSLVFVETLYLNVENAVGIKNNASLILNVFSEMLFISLFNVHKLRKNIFVVLKLSELFKLCAVLDKFSSDSFAEKLCKSGIGLIKPSSVSDAVGNVLEFFRSILVFIVEYRFLDYLGMKLGNAVYAV